MSSVLWVTVLTSGLTAQTWDGSGDGLRRSLEELKRSVEHLRRAAQEQRVEELKQKINELRSEKLEAKLNEIRRDVSGHPWGPPHGLHLFHAWGWPHPHALMPRAQAAPPDRALVQVMLPAGATLFANDTEVAVPPLGTPFLTPALERGKTYHYDFRVRVSRDGQVVTRTKRLAVSPGSVAHLTFEDMTPAERE